MHLEAMHSRCQIVRYFSLLARPSLQKEKGALCTVEDSWGAVISEYYPASDSAGKLLHLASIEAA